MSEKIYYNGKEFSWNFKACNSDRLDFIWNCFIRFPFSGKERGIKLVVEQYESMLGDYCNFSGNIYYAPNNPRFFLEREALIEKVDVSMEGVKSKKIAFETVLDRAFNYIEEIKNRDFDGIDLEKIKINLDHKQLCQTCSLLGYKVIAYIDSLEFQKKSKFIKVEILLPSKIRKYKIYDEKSGNILIEAEAPEYELDNSILKNIKLLINENK